jgi:hypothetical protein
MREYLSIQQQEHQDYLAEALVHREHELYQYDVNIENYTAMLSALPAGEWPAEIVQYKGKTADQVPDELDDIVGEYNYRDRLRQLLKTEKQERRKSKVVFDALKTQLPTGKQALQAVVDAAVIRIKAKQA